jgi:MFS family permease
MGTGATYVLITATISRWFDKKRGFALGIASSGTGLGMIAIPPTASFLISTFDWRTAYTIIGLVASLMIVLLSRLLRNNPNEKGATLAGPILSKWEEHKLSSDLKRGPVQTPTFSILRLLKTRIFWLFELLWLFVATCQYFTLTHIVPHAVDIGISTGKSATILSLIGGSSIAGRVIMGKASDILGRKAGSILCSLLMGGAMLWLVWVQDLWMLYVFALIYGFGFGGVSTTVSLLIADVFGLQRIGVVLGLLDVGWGIGGALGPATGGIIFDVTNSYSLAFVLFTVVIVMVALLIIFRRFESSP